jgi:hypothetical protein
MADLDRETLEAALIGYEHQKAQIEAKIHQLRVHLGGHVTVAPNVPLKKKGRRKFSAETRQKMAAAQQRRWTAKHAEVASVTSEPATETAKPIAKKRAPLSAEARESIAVAQRKRWAASKKATKKPAKGKAV